METPTPDDNLDEKTPLDLEASINDGISLPIEYLDLLTGQKVIGHIIGSPIDECSIDEYILFENGVVLEILGVDEDFRHTTVGYLKKELESEDDPEIRDNLQRIVNLYDKHAYSREEHKLTDEEILSIFHVSLNYTAFTGSITDWDRDRAKLMRDHGLSSDEAGLLTNPLFINYTDIKNYTRARAKLMRDKGISEYEDMSDEDKSALLNDNVPSHRKDRRNELNFATVTEILSILAGAGGISNIREIEDKKDYFPDIADNGKYHPYKVFEFQNGSILLMRTLERLGRGTPKEKDYVTNHICFYDSEKNEVLHRFNTEELKK